MGFEDENILVFLGSGGVFTVDDATELDQRPSLFFNTTVSKNQEKYKSDT